MRLRVLATVLVAFSLTFVEAQGPPVAPKPQEQRPTFRTEANFVRVDAYPTADGRAVTDLEVEDFEVFEDGVPQRIETFERVTVRPAGAQATRVEPNTIAESLDMARNPRARVIILFLDVPHVTMQGAWTIREPLIRLLDQILGPDDLVGVMTPAMSAADLTLARKTQVIAGGLRDVWPWGERFTLALTEQEKLYEACYMATAPDVVSEMTARRRERATLEALDELVRHLRDLREERKAIVTVTEGWLLYRTNRDLERLRTQPGGGTEPIPGVDPITVGPDGKLTTKNTRTGTGYRKSECDADRMRLTHIDNFQFIRDIIDDANRANATFYTVDPRGLPVFDSVLGPAAPPSPLTDAAMLRTRQDAMRMLADNTDGISVVNTNDLDRGLRRIADDLTSYYLLGYYSTNARPDGKFHAIKVRVKRPGVDVRARRGYRAATAEEVARARSAPAAPVPESAASVTAAVDALSRLRPDARLHLNAVAWSGGAAPVVWVAGEVPPRGGSVEWAQGGTADVEVKHGTAVVTERVTLAAGQRSFLARIAMPATAVSGQVEVRVRTVATAAPSERAMEAVTTAFAAGLGRPLLFRRGLGTGNRQQPVAGFLFSRSDRARVEIPLPAGATLGSGRLLGRNGEPIAVPVTVGERTDGEDGQRWLTADLTLAPLAPADYVIEVTAKTGNEEQRVVTAIRVGR